MAKTKTPFLSLGSAGTVGGILTAQKRGRATLLRSTPKPTDPYSLAQAYQRWDYRDYAYLWTLLSNSEKQVYRTRASRYHITGYSLWMREHLRDLPDIAARWHLDEKGGAIAHDSSRNQNNGVIIGASPATGVIDGAFSFDGINDWLLIPTSPSLSISGAISVEFFFTIDFPGSGGYALLINQYNTPSTGFFASRSGTLTKVRFVVNPGPGEYAIISGLLSSNTHYHFCATHDGINTLRLFINGQQAATPVNGVPIAASPQPLYVGSHAGPWLLKGLLDHIAILNRALDDTEIKRHSERRYPS